MNFLDRFLFMLREKLLNLFNRIDEWYTRFVNGN